jgi:hypothetical protein
MKQRHTLQRQFETAFDNYLKLTELLRSDLDAMLSHETKALHWRRNFVRASVALLEGHAHCLRQLCVVALTLNAAEINSKERRVIEDERAFDTSKRMKLTLSAAYKLFSLSPRPDFGTGHWSIAQRAIRKRHRLTHPKRPRDLGMSDRTWRTHKRGIVWLLRQFFDFLSLSQAKYGS